MAGNNGFANNLHVGKYKNYSLVGGESLHHDQLQGDGNAAGPGTTL